MSTGEERCWVGLGLVPEALDYPGHHLTPTRQRHHGKKKGRQGNNSRPVILSEVQRLEIRWKTDGN